MYQSYSVAGDDSAAGFVPGSGPMRNRKRWIWSLSRLPYRHTGSFGDLDGQNRPSVQNRFYNETKRGIHYTIVKGQIQGFYEKI